MLLKTLYDASYSVVQGVGARRVGDVRRVVQCRTRCRGPTRRKIPISTVVQITPRVRRAPVAAVRGVWGGGGGEPNEGELSGTLGRLTLCNTAADQKLLDCNHSRDGRGWVGLVGTGGSASCAPQAPQGKGSQPWGSQHRMDFPQTLGAGSGSNGHNGAAQYSKRTKMLPTKSTLHKGYNFPCSMTIPPTTRRGARRRTGDPRAIGEVTRSDRPAAGDRQPPRVDRRFVLASGCPAALPPPPPPPCNIPSGCCSFTEHWAVTRSSLRMLCRVAAFCRLLRPVLLLVSFPRSRSPVAGVLGLCWMWHGVPFARQRRPIIGVLSMCWLLPGSFDCFCCPRASVHRPSITCLAVFQCA